MGTMERGTRSPCPSADNWALSLIILTRSSQAFWLRSAVKSTNDRQHPQVGTFRKILKGIPVAAETEPYPHTFISVSFRRTKYVCS